MNKDIFDLVEKVFTFLKVEDYNKLKNILTAIEKDYPNYYKIFSHKSSQNIIFFPIKTLKSFFLHLIQNNF